MVVISICPDKDKEKSREINYLCLYEDKPYRNCSAFCVIAFGDNALRRRCRGKG